MTEDLRPDKLDSIPEEPWISETQSPSHEILLSTYAWRKESWFDNPYESNESVKDM